ncbi:hypothetical protein HK405_001744 [Cladochytrium tenue]|nr:hypothetical protein HK405_001744 [Cladochytrium tenue]
MDEKARTHAGRQSTKVRALVEDLVRVRKEDAELAQSPSKSVIFSQWTSVLDLLEAPLIEAGFKFHRLDGNMRRIERTMAMDQFKSDPEVTILLISLKAGGVGLNLTVASRVYIIEPYWNPAVEQQAVDRVHRLGQTRVVNTVRFVARGTIEENIIALQRRKMELARMAFKEVDSAGAAAAAAAAAAPDDKRARARQRRENSRQNKEALAREKLVDLQILLE